jgi:hypothetical protein
VQGELIVKLLWEADRALNTSERKLCDGNVVLFRRKGSRRWQARIRRNTGRWVVYSTGQKDKVEGKEDGLLKDDFGNARTLYCLRHTYASRRMIFARVECFVEPQQR